jgi:AcrR family transcriptional regulator
VSKVIQLARQAVTEKNKKKPKISERSGPVRGSRSAQKEDTRERVRQAALELFSTVGFDQTTTKAVAERAGVASGTVFVHAADKTDLLSLVMASVLEDAVEQGFASAPSEGLQEQLLAVFGAVFAAYGKVPNLAAPFVRTLPNAKGPNSERVQAFTFEFLTRIAARVSAAQARGEIDETVPPLLLAQNVFALYFFALMSWISGYATVESALRPHLEMALSLQLRGLAKPR